MEYQRSPSLYFSDGDIILSAFSGPKTRAVFRVHRIFLSHYSEVFRDMFAVASDDNVQEKYDSIPVVNMPEEDTADAVGRLLDVMYNASSLHIQLQNSNQSDVPFLQMGLVRLAKKYMVQDIATVIIDHVRSQWPTTSTEYTAWLGKRRAAISAAQSTGTPEPLFPEPASALVFAREHGIPSILTATYYCLSLTNPSLDFDALARQGAPTQRLNAAARWSLLDRDTLLSVMRFLPLVRTVSEVAILALRQDFALSDPLGINRTSDKICRERTCETIGIIRDMLKSMRTCNRLNFDGLGYLHSVILAVASEKVFATIVGHT